MGDEGKEDVLYRDILILHVVGGFLRLIQHLINLVGNIDFPGFPSGTGHMRQRLHGAAGVRLQSFRRYAHFQQQLGDQPLILRQQGIEEVFLFQLHILMLDGDILSRLDGFQGFLGEFLGVHKLHLLSFKTEAGNFSFCPNPITLLYPGIADRKLRVYE